MLMDESNSFIQSGKMQPGHWIEDTRELKPIDAQDQGHKYHSDKHRKRKEQLFSKSDSMLKRSASNHYSIVDTKIVGSQKFKALHLSKMREIKEDPDLADIALKKDPETGQNALGLREDTVTEELVTE